MWDKVKNTLATVGFLFAIYQMGQAVNPKVSKYRRQAGWYYIYHIYCAVLAAMLFYTTFITSGNILMKGFVVRGMYWFIAIVGGTLKLAMGGSMDDIRGGLASLFGPNSFAPVPWPALCALFLVGILIYFCYKFLCMSINCKNKCNKVTTEFTFKV